MIKMKFALVIGICLFGCASATAQTHESPCPKFSLKGPQGITSPGDAIIFYIEAKDPKDLDGVLFEWKVTGRDLNGQGTPRIQVPTTTKDSLSTITATVKIMSRATGCSAFLSESASVNWAGPGPDHYWWDVSVSKRGDLKAQLDLFFAELTNNPSNEGVIELTFTKEDSKSRKISRLNIIRKHILFRRFDPSRISFYFKTSEFERIRTTQVVPGADMAFLGIDKLRLLKAEEYKPKVTRIF